MTRLSNHTFGSTRWRPNINNYTNQLIPATWHALKLHYFCRIMALPDESKEIKQCSKLFFRCRLQAEIDRSKKRGSVLSNSIGCVVRAIDDLGTTVNSNNLSTQPNLCIWHCRHLKYSLQAVSVCLVTCRAGSMVPRALEQTGNYGPSMLKVFYISK